MADPYDTPGYRYSVNEFPGDGTTINWNIQFAGRSPGYISIDHVRASIIDEDGVETLIPLSQSNFVQPTLLRIEPAVPVGSVLRVWRDTPKDEPLLDYNDGALMTERNLDTSFDQAVYAAAEMVDRAADSLEDVAEFSQAVLDRLAEVEDVAGDAAADAAAAVSTANTALSTANAAVVTANDALAGVQGAEEAALLATAAANAANAAASAATTAANDAEQAALDALSTSASALSVAENAETVALGIDSKAQDALDTAGAAVVTASNAESVALGIDAKAQDALDTANAAVAAANAAESTALGIDAKATQALDDSADALSTVQSLQDSLGTAATRDVGTGANEVPTNSDLGSAAFLEALGTGPLYGRDSIVGPVSQAAGVPAGAIIESGSNANGEYVKWADGTQICLFRTSVTDQAINTAYSGGLYQGTRAWVFPAAFVTTPVTTCSEFRWGNGASWGMVAGATANGATLRGLDSVSRAAGTATISAVAIGRWY